MSNYHHKPCGGQILPHPNHDIAFCCNCGGWVEDFGDIFIKWDIMNLSGNDAAQVNG